MFIDISGPILVTHTANDKAVGIMYPIASRISGENAATLGNKDDEYGGIGRNGAINLEHGEIGRADTLLDMTGKYTFDVGKANNLLADKLLALA